MLRWKGGVCFFDLSFVFYLPSRCILSIVYQAYCLFRSIVLVSRVLTGELQARRLVQPMGKAVTSTKMLSTLADIPTARNYSWYVVTIRLILL